MLRTSSIQKPTNSPIKEHIALKTHLSEGARYLRVSEKRNAYSIPRGRSRYHISRDLLYTEHFFSFTLSFSHSLSESEEKYACIMMYRIIEIKLWEVHLRPICHSLDSLHSVKCKHHSIFSQ